MEKIIDLHVHTNKSDGAYTPKEIIDLANKNKVSVLAIADHDTIDAYDDDLFMYAKSKNIKLIPAVEISTKNKKCGIHILGYNIDLNNKYFKDSLYQLRNSRHIYLNDVSKKIEELGYIVNFDKLDKVEAVTKAHIALDVINNENNKQKLLDYFDHIPSKGEFIETIMNEGCPAYVLKKTITPLEAANLIRKANGKVILAHPVAYYYEDGLNDNDILSLVKEINADGIEANYMYVDKDENKHDDINNWKKFAIDNRLNYTIGSDFHKEDGIRPVIGLINDLELSIEEIENIIEFIEK